MLPRLTTIESSLRSFQYKILNNILYLNDRLFKFNIVDSPLCSLCKLENESVLHIFCRCMITKNLWKQLQILMPSIPSLEPEIVILGLWNRKIPNFILINHIILIFKRYIYIKKDKHSITINGMKAFIKNIEKIERKIASQRGKLDFHYKKWDPILPKL